MINRYYNLQTPLVIDFEVTNKNNGDPNTKENKIILVSYKLGNNNIQTKINDNDLKLANFLNSLLSKATCLVAHNAKFEIGWLYRLGLHDEVKRLDIWDTLLIESLKLSNVRQPLSLEQVAKRYGYSAKQGYVARCIKAGVCPSELPLRLLREYCEDDVTVTEKIFLDQSTEICLSPRESNDNFEVLCKVHCELIKVLADVEREGLKLSCSDVEKTYKDHAKRKKETEDSLYREFGRLNYNSNDQVARLLYDELGFSEPKDWRGNPLRTATNRRSASKEAISRLKANNKRQRRFLELYNKRNELTSLLTKYLEKFYDCCKNGDGYIYASLNQTNTQTHRLSSTGKEPYKIQIQNIDRDFKPLFKAPDNYYYGEFDYGQLEFRVAAYLGKDQQAISDIKNSFDVHQFTADTIGGISRQEAKKHTFKPLYGGRSGSPDERRYYEAFRKKYRGIAKAQDTWIQEALKGNPIKLPTGLRFYFPGTRLTETGYIINTTKICNYPVQYLATGEIITCSAIVVWYELQSRKLKSRIVNIVHDSLLLKIPEDEVAIIKDLLPQLMTEGVIDALKYFYNMDFNVPLSVDYKIGKYWGKNDATS